LKALSKIEVFFLQFLIFTLPISDETIHKLNTELYKLNEDIGKLKEELSPVWALIKEYKVLGHNA
jgi:hypothetical protein